jgi:hypothetical protein
MRVLRYNRLRRAKGVVLSGDDEMKLVARLWNAMGLSPAGEAAKARVLAPPPLEPNEHVLWEADDHRKRLTFTVRGPDQFVLTVLGRIDTFGEDEKPLTKGEVREIVERIVFLAGLK